MPAVRKAVDLSIGVKMNVRNIIIGIVFIAIGIWFYVALSTFEVEEGTTPKRIVIREGIFRTEHEVARVLADEIGFDLDGAYTSGFTPRDVIDFLMKEPHSYRFTFYNGRYYEGRTTIRHIIPFSVCIGMVLIGTLILLFKSRAESGKS
jgi:hypothetical protein